MRLRLYSILIILVLVSSCGEYEKLLKSTDFDLKKTKAIEYYKEGQYVKSTEIFAQILPRFRATEEAEELNWMNAESFYGMKDFYMAGSYYKSFIDQFPFGKHAEDANFMAAFCDYKIAPRSELDQENTKNAIEGFKIFMNRFPGSSRVEEAKKLVKELEEKLVEKSYLSAKLYYDMKQYKAAVIALNNSLKEYADTKYREEMMFLKLNSLYLYALNSQINKQKERYQATLDDYYSFMEEFPKSQYSKEVSGIFEKTNRYLKVGIPEGVVK
ncbi:MAG: outer membrane protein assembly factor BamD [Bacteroidetes bacterium]|nr:MAG: outer membrane protein assembly factor BamD [Bacteroidota bacterium]